MYQLCNGLIKIIGDKMRKRRMKRKEKKNVNEDR